MQVEVKIDKSLSEPKIIIQTNKITDDITELIQMLSEDRIKMIAGFYNDNVVMLAQENIIRFYSADSKVFAVTESQEYTIRSRLYELENKLDKSFFVRISNSEIINLKKVKGFDLSFTGTICVSFIDNSVSYVSRRYVSKIKKILGI